MNIIFASGHAAPKINKTNRKLQMSMNQLRISPIVMNSIRNF
jgi:hypothetical protein